MNSVHASADISPSATIGVDNTFGANVIVEDDVVIGRGNIFMNGVVIRSGSRIGDNNTLHDYAVLGGLPQDIGFDPSRSTSVILGNGNTLREYVTVNRATNEDVPTRIGDGCYLMVHAHVGHDCQLADHVIIATAAGLGGHVKVSDRAFISGGVMVHQFVKIGRMAMIGGNTKLTRDALPMMITDGNPASLRGPNSVGMKRNGYSADDLRIMKRACIVINDRSIQQAETLETLRNLGNALADELVDAIVSADRGYHSRRS